MRARYSLSRQARRPRPQRASSRRDSRCATPSVSSITSRIPARRGRSGARVLSIPMSQISPRRWRKRSAPRWRSRRSRAAVVASCFRTRASISSTVSSRGSNSATLRAIPGARAFGVAAPRPYVLLGWRAVPRARTRVGHRHFHLLALDLPGHAHLALVATRRRRRFAGGGVVVPAVLACHPIRYGRAGTLDIGDGAAFPLRDHAGVAFLDADAVGLRGHRDRHAGYLHLGRDVPELVLALRVDPVPDLGGGERAERERSKGARETGAGSLMHVLSLCEGQPS